MKKVNIFLFIVFCIISVSCAKNNTDANAPSNLQVTANVSVDSSGNVAFTATANNATSYSFQLGNGTTLTSTTGLLSYTYQVLGTYTYSVVVTATSSSGASISKTVFVTVTVAKTATNATGSLVWSDEFNTTGAPDPTKWKYDLGAGGWGNNELEYYTNRSSNVTVSNGTLKITAIKESFNGSNYTSGRILTSGLYSFKYGRIDISAKLPAGGGVWPAIWSLGNNFSSAGWPTCGEMDIMEYIGNNPNTIFSTFHYPGNSGGNAISKNITVQNLTTSFHLYTLQWGASTIGMYVDGKLVNSIPNNQSLPFNQNFFLILNVAMGGNFGGTVDPAFTSGTMEIDYIRVYQ
jgi:beta-glucanase (GH16 family)